MPTFCSKWSIDSVCCSYFTPLAMKNDIIRNDYKYSYSSIETRKMLDISSIMMCHQLIAAYNTSYLKLYRRQVFCRLSLHFTDTYNKINKESSVSIIDKLNSIKLKLTNLMMDICFIFIFFENYFIVGGIYTTDNIGHYRTWFCAIW